MKNDVAKFVYSCLVCPKSKIEYQKPFGLMQPLSIHEWKWDNISMNFIVSFPRTVEGCDSIWVIVDSFTKSAHFIPINITYPLKILVEIYISEIVRLHEISSSIISDRNPRFTSRF